MEIAEKSELFECDSSISSILRSSNNRNKDTPTAVSNSNHEDSKTNLPQFDNDFDFLERGNRKKDKRARSYSMPNKEQANVSQNNLSNKNYDENDIKQLGRHRLNRENENGTSSNEYVPLSASSFRNLSDSWRRSDQNGEWYKVIHSEDNKDSDDLFPVILRSDTSIPPSSTSTSQSPSLPSPNFNAMEPPLTNSRSGVLSPFKEEEAPSYKKYKKSSAAFVPIV